MPAVIDSAPSCVTHDVGTEVQRANDSADFILQHEFVDCGGFMTFGPGTAYGETGADTAYYILTYIGIAFTIGMLILWVIYENRELIREALRLGRRGER